MASRRPTELTMAELERSWEAAEAARTIGQATLSKDRRYRYWLARQLEPRPNFADPAMLFVMLNPSTADAFEDDPTIRRCAGFARREGFVLLEVVNLFAHRATQPVELLRAVDPVGPDNDDTISRAVERAGMIVVAWGALHPRLAWRAAHVRSLLLGSGKFIHCLGFTRHGHPRHPLRLRGDTPLKGWLP